VQFYVTGARGFLGRHLVPRLRELGSVVTLDGDILDPGALAGAAHADVVFHLAAQSAPLKGEEDRVGTVRTNVVGTINVAAAMRPGARLVFASTAHVYAPARTPCTEGAPLAPISAYGNSKLAAEYALRAMAEGGPMPVILRLFNVYGPGQSETYVVGKMLAAMRRGETPVLGAAHPVRDFVHIDDVVDAMVRAANVDVLGPTVVNVGNGVGVTIRELAEATGRAVRFEGGSRAADSDHLVADITTARHLLAWTPRVALKDGLARSLA
jgi:nucleoside-diphosphate-sugar epimerase